MKLKLAIPSKVFEKIVECQKFIRLLKSLDLHEFEKNYMETLR